MNSKAAYAYSHSLPAEPRSAASNKSAEVFGLFSSAYARERRESMSLTDYLEGCREDPGKYATAAERMNSPA